MDKAELRRLVRRRRAALDPATRRRAEASATAAVLALPEVAAADRVLAYASHGDELGTDGLLGTLVDGGARLLLPRVAGDELEIVTVGDPTDLPIGYRGVREPIGPADPDLDVDVVIVPGVAFDGAGGRLGQGGGHYDRLLARLPASTVRVGLCFAVQLVERLPREAHDQPVDVLVTEDGARHVATR